MQWTKRWGCGYFGTSRLQAARRGIASPRAILSRPQRIGPVFGCAARGDHITHAEPDFGWSRCRDSRSTPEPDGRRRNNRRFSIPMAATTMKQLLEAGVHFGH